MEKCEPFVRSSGKKELSAFTNAAICKSTSLAYFLRVGSFIESDRARGGEKRPDKIGADRKYDEDHSPRPAADQSIDEEGIIAPIPDRSSRLSEFRHWPAQGIERRDSRCRCRQVNLAQRLR
jgi:hypothetical protein